jgi:hypothetical protein
VPFHPASELFPLLEGVGYEQSRDDIRDQGLRLPIHTYKGIIIGGRNRYRACRELRKRPVAYLGLCARAGAARHGSGRDAVGRSPNACPTSIFTGS